MRKTFLYKGFYLSTCETKDWKTPWIGTLYSKRFDSSREWNNHYYYPKNITHEFGEEVLITTMKKEVDKFLIKYKNYLVREIGNIKELLSDKISDLSFVEWFFEEE